MGQQKTFDTVVQRWMANQEAREREVDISVIVPAYNEERRLPPTLIDMVDYFDERGESYEIIVVDDGSSDHTADTVKKFGKVRPQIRLIRLPRNYGKGHAVRTGMLNGRGRLILFADADGATPIGELERLREAIDEEGADIAIGSRAMDSSETRTSTVWYRKALGRVFNFVVNCFVLPEFRDTQCGFKLFTAPAARYAFEQQQSDGFSFDVEILFIARSVGLVVHEVPVNWTNIPGSKVNLVLDSMRMLRDIFVFQVRHRHLTPEHYRSFLDRKLDEEKEFELPSAEET